MLHGPWVDQENFKNVGLDPVPRKQEGLVGYSLYRIAYTVEGLRCATLVQSKFTSVTVFSSQTAALHLFFCLATRSDSIGKVIIDHNVFNN